MIKNEEEEIKRGIKRRNEERGTIVRKRGTIRRKRLFVKREKRIERKKIERKRID